MSQSHVRPVKCTDRYTWAWKSSLYVRKTTTEKNLSLSEYRNHVKETTVFNTVVRTYMLHFGYIARFFTLHKQLKFKYCTTCIFKCEVKCSGKLSEIAL